MSSVTLNTSRVSLDTVFPKNIPFIVVISGKASESILGPR